jgi:lipoprotein signal peptidase
MFRATLLWTRAKTLSITLILIVFDRISKTLISLSIPQTATSEPALKSAHLSLFNDGIWIVHVKNSLYMFGIAPQLSSETQALLFGLLPALFICSMVALYLFSKTETSIFRRRALAILFAGALANEIDRILYGGRVIDFLGLRFLRKIGLAHWPIANIGDVLVAVAAVLLAGSLVKSIFFSKDE